MSVSLLPPSPNSNAGTGSVSEARAHKLARSAGHAAPQQAETETQLSSQALELARLFDQASQAVKKQYLQLFMAADGRVQHPGSDPADAARQLLDQATRGLLEQTTRLGIALDAQEVAGQLKADTAVFMELLSAGIAALSASRFAPAGSPGSIPAGPDTDQQIFSTEATQALQKLMSTSTSAKADNKYADIEDSGLPEAIQSLLKHIRDLKEQIREKMAEISKIQNDHQLDEKTRKSKLAKAQAELGVLIAALVMTTDMLRQVTMDMKAGGMLSAEQVQMAGQLAAI